MPQIQDRNVDVTYSLPETIKSIRDGWQLTIQSAAVVSGLLAGVAAQLYGFFKDPNNFPKATSPKALEFITAFCYFSMFFNIGATISSFILMDGLGELQYSAASMDPTRRERLPISGRMRGTTNTLLLRYGIKSWWTILAWHWLASFFCGIVSLLILLLAYVFLQETKLMKILMTILVSIMLFPLLVFIFAPPQQRQPPDAKTAVAIPSPNINAA